MHELRNKSISDIVLSVSKCANKYANLTFNRYNDCLLMRYIHNAHMNLNFNILDIISDITFL